MRFTDFTVHLADATDAGTKIHTADGEARTELARMLREIETMSELDIQRRLDDVSKLMREKGCVAFNAMIMDQRVLDADERPAWLDADCRFTLLLDPRPLEAEARLNKAAAWGFNGIKFHPYMQGLGDGDFPAAVEIAKKAEGLGLWVAVDASYGTLDVFAQNGVRLAAAVAKEVKSAPIILMHLGGRMALEAMAVALAAPNVLLEMSLSIPFWLGSSVEQDFAFAIRQVGANRCMFSSDHPFIALDTALDATKGFFDKHGFSEQDQERMFLGAGLELFKAS